MTEKELASILSKMSDEEFRQFKADFGGDGTTPVWYVNNFRKNPLVESRLCELLKMPTEQQRRDDAAKRSADASVKSAHAAVISAWCAAGALLVSIAALVLSIVAYFKE